MSSSMNHMLMRAKFPLILPAVLLLSACGGNGGDDPVCCDPVVPTVDAVVATRAPDYSSGAVSLVETVAPYTARNNLSPTTSDIAVRADGDHYFLIERSTGHMIKRFEVGNPNTPTWAYSVLDSGESTANPYDIIVASDDKAYVLRYDSGKLWIVNPSAATEAEFKIGEIDLSAYDADGVPEMSAGLIVDGKLYVAMQRLQSYAATQSGFVAVIDTDTDQEITTSQRDDGLKGIELPARDPVKFAPLPSGNLLVLADGGYNGSFAETYEGGVVLIDTTQYTASLEIDDGDTAEHPHGQFVDFTVTDSGSAYLIGSTGFFGTQTLYRFSTQMADASLVAVDGFSDQLLGSVEVDPAGRLWLTRTDDSAPGLTVITIENGVETVTQALIDTELTPMNLDFVEVPAI